MSSENQLMLDDRLRHIAIIMDGNGRWATGRGLPREAGHKSGASALRKIVEYCEKIGLESLTVYAFSTENWKRPKREVDAIISLLKQYVAECERDYKKYNVHYRFIGDMSRFDETMQRRIARLDEVSLGNPLTLNIAFNYGGRSELARAFSKIAEQGKTNVSEEDISGALDTVDSGDPDLIIRTGGDLRISNFLLWQAAYAELYFTETLWPDFDEKEMEKAIRDFYVRKRRYGGI